MDCHSVKAKRAQNVIIVSVNVNRLSSVLKFIQIGGSISGLLCAIVLKHDGHNVHVLDQDSDNRDSHMAGICLGPDCQRLLQEHDRIPQPFSFESDKIQLLDTSAKPVLLLQTRRRVTSWDALYYRLRSNFDGYRSDYYPLPPKSNPQDGSAIYKARQKVIAINSSQSPPYLTLTVEDQMTKQTSGIGADIVIGADGPNSFVRRQYLPHCDEKYVGYVVWRGVVREDEVSSLTLKCFSRNVTVFMRGRHHCLAYLIPGPEGSVQPGERYINFAWYTNESESDLDAIMVNATTGHRHRKTVPSGQIRDVVWKKQLDHGYRAPLPPPFLEVLSKIRKPFVQAITELYASKAAFENGKVFLVGDGLNLLRPHTAFSASQAAFHVLTLRHVLENHMSFTEWETMMMRFGELHGAQSAWFGNFYQAQLLFATLSAVWYWYLCMLDRARAWYTGNPRLLRPS
jgi:2-polyprenyl-6-methoxyphenol hydroxylase-like FAD-dependent oxidoreductase